MPRKSPRPAPAESPSAEPDMSFEARMTRLQAIVTALEAGNSSLEESVVLYKEGLAHTAACRAQLAAARHEIELCSEGLLSPFEPEADSDEREEEPFRSRTEPAGNARGAW